MITGEVETRKLENHPNEGWRKLPALNGSK